MIHWKPAHSAAVTAVSLAASILLFYLFTMLPVVLPAWLGVIMACLTAVLLAAVVDHGLSGAPLPKRWRRFGISVVTILAWLEVAQSMVIMAAGTSSARALSHGGWLTAFWREVGPLAILSAVLAWLGMLLARWLERTSTALLVIDQPGTKAYHRQ